MLVMITKNKLLPFLFIILSSTGFAQSIDQSIISQLSEDQISLAISSLESENLTKDDPTLEEDSDETLLANENQDDPNNSVDKKFGYDFFQNIPTSTSAVGDLPLPNDYKISIKDQLEFTTDVKRIIELEEQLFEVEDTISKLTNPIKTHEEKTN